MNIFLFLFSCCKNVSDRIFFNYYYSSYYYYYYYYYYYPNAFRNSDINSVCEVFICAIRVASCWFGSFIYVLNEMSRGHSSRLAYIRQTLMEPISIKLLAHFPNPTVQAQLSWVQPLLFTTRKQCVKFR